MKILKTILIILMFIPSISLANPNDNNTAMNEAAGKVFSDALGSETAGLIKNSTKDLKKQVFLPNDKISDSYDNAPLIGRILILASDSLHVSIGFLLAVFWIIGFAIFVFSWIHLRESVDDENGRYNKRQKSKWAFSGFFFGIALMGFNGMIMIWGDTFGVGTNVHSTYSFRNQDVDKTVTQLNSKKGGSFKIENGKPVFSSSSSSSLSYSGD